MTVKGRGVFRAWLPNAILALIALLALTGVIYGRGLRFPLGRDDVAHELDRREKNPRWQRSPVHLRNHFREEFWARGSQSGLYRPLTATTIQMTQWVAGLEPAALKLGNALLLVATGLAAAALARRLGIAPAAALLLGLLVVAHPLLTETVLEVVSRSETQAALGVLLAAYCIAAPEGKRSSAVMTCAWYLFALLSKEGAFAAAPALLVLALTGERPRATKWRLGCAVFVALVCAVLLRIQAFGDPVGLDSSAIPKLDNPLASEPWLTRTVTGVAVLGRYLAAFVWPERLSADWSFAAIVPARDAGDPWFLAGAAALVAALAALGVLARNPRANRAEIFGLLLALGSWWLISSVARPIGTIMAERLFVASAIGLLFALVAAVDRRVAGAGSRRIAFAAGLLVMAALAARSYVRVGDWRDGLALYTAASQVAPDSARVQCTLAHIVREKGDAALAKPYAERAVNILPEYGKANAELAACLAANGSYGRALVHQWLSAHATGATMLEQLQFGAAVRRYGSDPRVMAEFKSYGDELVARRPDVPLHLALARELARMPK